MYSGVRRPSRSGSRRAVGQPNRTLGRGPKSATSVAAARRPSAEQDVGRLEVAVDDPLVVGGVDRGGERLDQRGGRGRRPRAGRRGGRPGCRRRPTPSPGTDTRRARRPRTPGRRPGAGPGRPASASSRNRRRSAADANRPERIIFSAPAGSARRCRARYTTPIPPRPTSATTSYSPIRSGQPRPAGRRPRTGSACRNPPRRPWNLPTACGRASRTARPGSPARRRTSPPNPPRPASRRRGVGTASGRSGPAPAGAARGAVRDVVGDGGQLRVPDPADGERVEAVGRTGGVRRAASWRNLRRAT